MNQPANQSSTPSDQTIPKTTSPSFPVSTGLGKENEAAASVETVRPVNPELELPKEVKEAGVTQFKETIELPPDIRKLGVTPSGASTPVVTSSLPTVVLPISDSTVVSGVHAQVTDALRWLAIWCLRRLKKAHIALKIMHGKIVRVKTS